MKGDFSRQTFRPEQRYSGVLMQQGRVQLDADWNEEHAIQQQRVETETIDVVGRTGTPKPGGFGISVVTNGKDLFVGGGRYYVDGILCVLDPEAIPVQVTNATSVTVPLWTVDNLPFAVDQWIELSAPGKTTQTRRISAVNATNHALTLDTAAADFVGVDGVTLRRSVTYNSQPDYFQPFDLTQAAGRYAVYLDVWERHMTPVEDPALPEVALNGEDTTTRLQTVWQVRAQRVGGVGSDACSDDWQPTLSAPGGLRAWTDAEPIGGNPCVLPPTGGYVGLENQLYRVEVQVGGTLNAGDTGATALVFKWSRDNGTVLSALEDFTGANVTLQTVGRDDALGFFAGQTVEISDDLIDLDGLAGQLLTITDDSKRASRQFVLSGSVSGVDRERHPKVRRWDGTGTIHIDPNGIALESGIRIQFLPGQYSVGDYWLIPARTVTSASTGLIEWPADDSGQPLTLPPEGVTHHYAALALVNYDGSAFQTANLADCRKLFPPLTAITAGDVSYINENCQLQNVTTVQQALDVLCQRTGEGVCDITLDPGDGWEQALAALADGEDANLCFRVGTYPLKGVLVIKGKGNLKVTGCGAGTKIVSASEGGLHFENCASLLVRDLSVETKVAGSLGEEQHLNGAITALNCPDVVIEHVSTICAGGSARAAAGITVRNDQPGDIASARILHNDLLVGHLQIGVLVVNVRRVEIEDNAIRVAGDKPASTLLLQDPKYRARLLDQIVSNVQTTAVPQAKQAQYNAHVTVGEQTIFFKTDATLTTGNPAKNVFQTLIDTAKQQNIASADDVRKYVVDTVDKLLLNPTQDVAGAQTIGKVIGALLNDDRPVASQGITVGGNVAEDVRILNNSISGALQGIHVGLSHKEAARGTPDSTQVVVVAHNTLHLRLPSSATRERHGIFVGNSSSAVIESNYLDVERFAKTENLFVEGVRIFGYVDRRMIVRENHMTNFNIGVRFTPLNVNFPSPQWIITDNVAVQAATVVRVTSGVPSVNDATVRAKVRGINDNFA